MMCAFREKAVDIGYLKYEKKTLETKLCTYLYCIKLLIGNRQLKV